MAAVISVSYNLAYRSRPIYLKFPDERDAFAIYRELLERMRQAIKIGLPILLGVFGGVAAISRWPIVMMWLNRTPSGTKDPQFGLDVSFYLFDLPFLSAAVTYLSAMVLLAGLVATAVHLVLSLIHI